MTDQHKGLPVAGYKPQSDANVALVNDAKQLEERCLRHADVLMAGASTTAAMGHDARMIAIGRTKLQEAFMWLNRAVFQPGRVALPEDTAPDHLADPGDAYDAGYHDGFADGKKDAAPSLPA